MYRHYFSHWEYSVESNGQNPGLHETQHLSAELEEKKTVNEVDK